MIFLKILGFALLILLALVIFFLVTPMCISVKYTPQKSKIYLRVGFIFINLDKSEKKKRVKKQSLKKHLKKQNAKYASVSAPKKDFQTSKAHLFTENTKPGENQSTQGTLNSPTQSTSNKDTQNPSSPYTSASTPTSLLEDLIQALKIIHPTEIIKLFTKTLSDIKDPLSQYAKVKIKKLDVSVASEDAAKTAIMYGVACIAYDQLIDVASEFSVMRIKEKNCNIYYDFAAEQSYASAHIKLSIAPIRAIPIALSVYNNISQFKI